MILMVLFKVGQRSVSRGVCRDSHKQSAEEGLFKRRILHHRSAKGLSSYMEEGNIRRTTRPMEGESWMCVVQVVFVKGKSRISNLLLFCFCFFTCSWIKGFFFCFYYSYFEGLQCSGKGLLWVVYAIISCHSRKKYHNIMLDLLKKIVR